MSGTNIFRLFGEIGLTGVDEVNGELEQTSQNAERTKENFKKNFSEMSTGVAGATKKIAGGIAAIGGIAIASVESTREFRQDLGKLNTTFEETGSSTETANNVFKEFYGLLGEDDTSIEASNHLAMLTNNEKDLEEWTRICTGVYANFGDSLPLEGLTEAINHTTKLGEVQGPLADALEWQGIATDTFNEKLATLNTEEEREALIRETLTGLYGDSADTFRNMNGEIINANKAQADLSLQTADLTGKLEPLITKGKEFLVNVLEKAQPLIDWVIEHFDVIAPIILGIVGALTIFSTTMGIVNAVMMASPISWIVLGIVAAITLLVTAIVLVVKNWDKIKETAVAVWETIKEVWGKVAEWFKTNVIDPIVNFFTSLWTSITEGVTNAWNFITGILATVGQWIYDNVITPIVNFFTPIVDFFVGIITSILNFYKEVITVIIGLAIGLWNIIKRVFEVVGQWFYDNVISPVANFFAELWNGISNAASTAWEFIKGIWNVVSSWFNNTIIKPVANFFTGMWNGLKNGASNAWNGIKSVFSKVADFFGNIFSTAWNKVKSIFSTGGKIFSGIVDGIKSAFTNVVNAIIRGINRVVKIPFDFINGTLNKIRNIEFLGISPFKGLWKNNPISVPQIPQLYEGTVLEKGQVGLLEGKGAEAVVPLHNNKKWISAVADDMQGALSIGDTSNLESKLDTLINLLTNYLPALMNRQLVTDTGALVGALVDPLDVALADKEKDRRRGR